VIATQWECESAAASLGFDWFTGVADLNGAQFQSSRTPGCHMRTGYDNVWGLWFNPNAASPVPASTNDMVLCTSANASIPVDIRPCPFGTFPCSSSLGRKGGCFSPVGQCAHDIEWSCDSLMSITAPGACGSGCTAAFIDKVSTDLSCQSWNRTSTCTTNSDCPAFASYCMNGAGKSAPFVCHGAHPRPFNPVQPTCSNDVDSCYCSASGKNYIIKAAVKLSGVTKAQFNAAVQRTFQLSVVVGMPDMGLDVDDCIIESYNDARRASALSVEFSVDTGTTDQAVANSASNNMNNYLSSKTGFQQTLKQNVASAGQTFPVQGVAVTQSASASVEGGSSSKSGGGMAGGAVAALVICILVVVIVSVIGVGCFVMKSGGEAEGHASDITIEPEGVTMNKLGAKDADSTEKQDYE